jgi:hypothetical protein
MRDQANILSALQARDGSADWSKWQIHRWPFYDYVRLNPAGVNQLTFFQNALGSTDPVSALAKTEEQTNMNKSGTFGQVYFFLKEIRTHVSLLSKGRQPGAISGDADLLSSTIVALASLNLQLFRQGVLQMSIGQKSYFTIERPFLTAPPGFGIEVDQIGVLNGATATPNLWVRQSPFMQETFAIEPVQMIEPEQNFAIQIVFPDANTPTFTDTVTGASPAINVGVILDGYIVRPAQ